MLRELRYFCIRIFKNPYMFDLFSPQCFITKFAKPNWPIPTDLGHPYTCALSYMPSSYSLRTY